MAGFPGSPPLYIAAAAFALVLLPASGSVGFGAFILNLLAFAGCIAPFVVAYLERDQGA